MTETPKQEIDLTVDKKLFNGFDEEIQKKGDLFVQEMKNAETKDKKGEIKEKAASFERNGGIMLKLILGDMKKDGKFETIDPTDKEESKLQTYIDAKKAFEEDMKALNIFNVEIITLLSEIQNVIDKQQQSLQDKTDINQIAQEKTAKTFNKSRILELQQSTELQKMEVIVQEEIKKLLQERLSTIESEEAVILNKILAKKPSEVVAKELFENNQIARESLMTNKWEFSDQNKSQQQKNFEELLNIYGSKPMNPRGIISYTIRNYATENEITQINNKKIDTRNYGYIQIKLAEVAKTENTPTILEQTKDIMFGTNSDRIHMARAEIYKSQRDEGKSVENNLIALNDKGSYREFKNILDAKGAEAPEFLSGLLENKLLEDIHSYKSKIDDQETKTNGYYGAILEYIVNTKNEGLLTKYLNKVWEDGVLHTEYLGTDWKNQVENFNKIVDKTKLNIDKNSVNGKLLEKIRGQLAQTTSPKNFQETLSKGLDALIDQFGPLLFSVLKMFGLGKSTLIKKFGAKDKINEMFKKEFILSENQLKDTNKILYDKDGEPNFPGVDLTEKGRKRLETGKDIESKFSNKNEYEKLITEGEYYKSINVNIFQKGLDLYNKEKEKKSNINDIVTIKTDNATGKQSIVGIKDNITFTGAIHSILNNDSIRSSIAQANGEIQISTEEKNIKTGINQQGLEVGEEKEASRYKIQTEQDIARYLTAALFSNKDLSYVMTENQLHNRKEITTKDETKEKEEAKQKFEVNWGILFDRIRNNVKDDGLYKTLNTDNFTGKEADTDTVALEYKNNIITPLQDLLSGNSLQGNASYPNYDFVLEKFKSENFEDKINNEKLMTSIKNILKTQDNKDYETTIAAIQKGNTYEISILDNKEITFKTKDSSGKETGTITLGVVDNKINTKRMAVDTKATEEVAQAK